MNEIKVTVELCAEDRARLDKLTAALENYTPPIIGVDLAQADEAPQEAQPETPQAVAEPEPAEENPSEERPTITHDMIHQKVKEFIANGSAAQNEGARKAVTSRAKNISGLPADCLADVWAELEALGEPAKED